MSQSTHSGDLLVTGSFRAIGGFAAPAGSVTDAMIATGAGVTATKLEFRRVVTYAQAWVTSTDNVDEDRTVAMVYGTTGTIIAAYARNRVAPGGSDTTTVDVKKNGTTVLSTPISLATADGTTRKSGTLSVTTLAAGDWLSVVINATGTTPGEGIEAIIVYDEDAV